MFARAGAAADGEQILARWHQTNGCHGDDLCVGGLFDSQRDEVQRDNRAASKFSPEIVNVSASESGRASAMTS